MRKSFKTGMCVTGSPALLKSIIDEAKKLGWEFSEGTIPSNWLRLYNDGSFGYFTTPQDFMEYSLSEDWNEVVAFLASGEDVEKEVVAPKVKKVAAPKKKVTPSDATNAMIDKYVKLYKDECGFMINDIGIIEKYQDGGCLVSVPNRKSTSCYKPLVFFGREHFTLSTKEAYDAQHNPTTKLKVGDHVEIVKNQNGGNHPVGSVGIIDNTDFSYVVIINGVKWSYMDYELKLVTKDDWLLSEAKRMYPVGTHYRGAEPYSYDNMVEHQYFYKQHSHIIYGEPGKGCLYYDGKWATIISEKPITIKFGSTVWLLDVENKTAASNYGTITLKEIEDCYNWIVKRPSLLGHGISTGDMTDISFGCQRGTFSQLDAIYSTLKG